MVRARSRRVPVLPADDKKAVRFDIAAGEVRDLRDQRTRRQQLATADSRGRRPIDPDAVRELLIGRAGAGHPFFEHHGAHCACDAQLPSSVFCAPRAADNVSKVTQTVRMTHSRTKIREWRKFRGLSQERLGELVGVSHTTIGRLERGRTRYIQATLESIARELQTDPASLLVRDPNDPEGIWAVWERIPPQRRREAIAVLSLLGKSDAAD
jgi:transcriptional regulator with XRE-family HTH domain